MKKFFTTLLLIAIIFNIQIYCQQSRVLSLGPYVGYKAGISAVNTPLGRKNGVSFNKIPDFGFVSYFPLSSENDIGLQIDLAYSTYSYMMISAHNENNKYKLSHSFLSINPAVFFNRFSLGFAFMLPIKSQIDISEIKNEIINNAAELKIGYAYPIYEDNAGELNVFINGGYFLTGVYKNFVKNDPMKGLLPTDEKTTNIHNPRVASIQLGFNFIFNLKEKKTNESVDDLYE